MNRRPLRPERNALANLSYTPFDEIIFYILHIIFTGQLVRVSIMYVKTAHKQDRFIIYRFSPHEFTHSKRIFSKMDMKLAM